MKSKVDKSDVDKLLHVPANLSKLSDAVQKDVVKKMDIMLRSKMWKKKYMILVIQY